MPDRRRHRGPHPRDAELFSDVHLPALRTAAADFAWLLDRGYPPNASLALIGNRFALLERQRHALSRAICSAAAATARKARRVQPAGLRGATLSIDGFNVLTTIEVALARGVVLDCRDGACRDLASMHGTWRRVHETDVALRHLGEWLAAAGTAACRWLLDRPVANSGRLAERMRGIARERDWPWDVTLIDSPDRELRSANGLIATADGPVLDRAGPWLDLSRRVIADRIPDAWTLDLLM